VELAHARAQTGPRVPVRSHPGAIARTLDNDPPHHGPPSRSRVSRTLLVPAAGRCGGRASARWGSKQPARLLGAPRTGDCRGRSPRPGTRTVPAVAVHGGQSHFRPLQVKLSCLADSSMARTSTPLGLSGGAAPDVALNPAGTAFLTYPWADRSGPRQPPPGRWQLDSCSAALCRWLERGPRGGGRKRQRRRRLAPGIGRRAGGCLRRHRPGHTRCRSTEHDDGRNAHPSLDRPGVGSLVIRRLGRVGLRRWRTARCERRSPRRAPDRGPQSERSARSQV
jgi:hypothetical protein